MILKRIRVRKEEISKEIESLNNKKDNVMDEVVVQEGALTILETQISENKTVE